MRVLSHHKHLEEKQIGEFAMIPVKDTRERLYTLLRAGLIVLREVHKRADYAPMHTYFLSACYTSTTPMPISSHALAS